GAKHWNIIDPRGHTIATQSTDKQFCSMGTSPDQCCACILTVQPLGSTPAIPVYFCLLVTTLISQHQKFLLNLVYFRTKLYRLWYLGRFSMDKQSHFLVTQCLHN